MPILKESPPTTNCIPEFVRIPSCKGRFVEAGFYGSVIIPMAARCCWPGLTWGATPGLRPDETALVPLVRVEHNYDLSGVSLTWSVTWSLTWSVSTINTLIINKLSCSSRCVDSAVSR